MANNLTYSAVNKDNWNDLERLFESRGGPHNCWCMVWREMGQGKSKNSKSDKKETLKKYVFEGTPVGLLCYDGPEPVAWCSIAPRDTYRDLSGNKSLRDVWALVCFFIKKEYRRQKMTVTLIEEALKYAKTNGAKYVEAYPVSPDSPSYRFMGFKPVFDQMGFEFHKKAGRRRNVMIIEF